MNVRSLKEEDRTYIDCLRGGSILRVVLVHLGLSWFLLPYSSYIGLLLPLLFFVSGVVSFYSFSRSKSAKQFLIKRTILILSPYYFLVVLAFIYGLLKKISIDPINYLGWLMMNPNTEMLGFSLGQVWFLQALAIITLIVYSSLCVSKKFNVLYVLFGLSFTLIIFNHHIGHEFLTIIYGNVDLYIILSNMSFFVLGPIYYERLYRWSTVKFFFVILCPLFSVFLYLVLKDSDLSLANNMERPDLLYFTGATFIIFSLLRLERFVTKLISAIKVDHLLKYSSRHAFSIYLLHTIVLAIVEHYVFKEPLTGEYGLAALRMFMVISITLFIVPVYTRIHKKISNSLVKLFVS